MRVIQDDFESLPASARELVFAVQKDEESNNLLPCVKIAQGGMLSYIH